MSSRADTARMAELLEKLYSKDTEHEERELIYMWVKQSYINKTEFLQLFKIAIDKQQLQTKNFLYEEICERRPYSASRMCEEVLKFIENNEQQ